MRCYKFGDLNITAASKEEAQLLANEVGSSQSRRIIMVYENGEVQMINLLDKECVIFTQTGNSVDRVGRLCGGTGRHIIQMAVDNIDKTREQGNKIRKAIKQRTHLQKVEDTKKFVDNFEDRFPSLIKDRMLKVINNICDDSITYKLELYERILSEGYPRPENWKGIIDWFEENVVPGNAAKYQKRNAFVTLVERMGYEERGVSNTVKKAAVNTNEFWENYTKE